MTKMKIPCQLSEDKIVEKTRGDGVVFHPAWIWSNLKTFSIIYIIFTPPIYITLVIKILAFLQSSLEWKSVLLPEASVWCWLLPHSLCSHTGQAAGPHTHPALSSSFQLTCCLLRTLCSRISWLCWREGKSFWRRWGEPLQWRLGQRMESKDV